MSLPREDPSGLEPTRPDERAGDESAVPITSGTMTRRVFFQSAAAPFAAAAMSRLVSAAGVNREPAPYIHSIPGPGVAQTNMGIASTSFMPPLHGAAPAGNAVPAAMPAAQSGSRAVSRPVWDAFEFLEKCHQLGAAGIQTEINGDPTALNVRAKQLGMWIEGMVSVPRNGDTVAFEQSLLQAKAAGATVVRTGMLGGRRYESFSTLDDWKRWVEQADRALALAVPLLDRLEMTLAIENHKDWTLDEMQRLLRTYESEYLGVCFDFGNNIALLDDPMEMATALAKYVRSTHVKDMGVRPYQDGFLLSEVPLGTGILDLPAIVSTLRRANPGLRLSLEMITRDPLKVPCLSPQYWTVFPDRNGKYLARTLKMVQAHNRDGPLPTVSQVGPDERIRIEEENVKACLSYAREKQL